ncbi:Cell polarity protein alp11 [Escovopsis weberi]|uniref:Cell polarity protein alp11 n=1 Tax=Escovopsis weberi TaxID=150374 RepID=A0A0M9VXB6_ESCWE|nr:Cell polarity protein alp11 [Escovopsis weberi]
MADVPMLVMSDDTSSERRITPAWSITQLKAKLEHITGVPPPFQQLSLQSSSGAGRVPLSAADEDATYLSSFELVPYAELHVADTRPPGARPNFADTSNVERYVMPVDEYEKKTDSVLAWKKAQKLGRFDPDAPARQAERLAALERDVGERGIAAGRRCRVGADDGRRGVVMYVGEVAEIPGGQGVWVGVRLDEPVGKNDGSIGGTRYWGDEGEGEAQGPRHGLFVRPGEVEVGEFPVLDDLEDMEEI